MSKKVQEKDVDVENDSIDGNSDVNEKENQFILLLKRIAHDTSQH